MKLETTTKIKYLFSKQEILMTNKKTENGDFQLFIKGFILVLERFL